MPHSLILATRDQACSSSAPHRAADNIKVPFVRPTQFPPQLSTVLLSRIRPEKRQRVPQTEISCLVILHRFLHYLVGCGVKGNEK